jgi:hypothetical protein
MASTEIMRPNGAVASTREGFGEREVSLQHETSAIAVAERARAQTQAKFIMAAQKPRDWDIVRERLLKTCRRPGFAAMALYNRPVGGGKSTIGPSIRFAEEAIRCMGNLDLPCVILYDDPHKRIIRIEAVDLENNVTHSVDVQISKTVERRQVKAGQQVIAARENSYGQTVYIVPGTDEEVAVKEAAIRSKGIRTTALRHLPVDILEDALQQISSTNETEVKADPDTARKKLIDAFGQIGVKVADLKTYVGGELESMQPKEVSELRAIFQAIRDGETSWREVMAEREGERKDEGQPSAKAQSLKEKVLQAAPKPDVEAK